MFVSSSFKRLRKSDTSRSMKKLIFVKRETFELVADPKKSLD